MSLLYKNKEHQKLEVEITQFEDKINITFIKDCGKHGFIEPIDFYKLTAERLLEILQDRDDYNEDEL